MNTQQFISYIERPDLLGKQDIGALKNIASDFPYFQVAQVLLTKALYNEKHYEFEKQLSRASLIVPDRTVLFQFIHQLQKVAESEMAIATEEPSSILQQTAPINEPLNEEVELDAIFQPVIENEKVEEVSTILEINEPTSETIPEAIVEIVNPSIEEIAAPIEEVETLPENKENTLVAEDENTTHSFLEWLSLQTTQKDSTPKIEVPTPIAEEKSSTPKVEKTIDEIAALNELVTRETEEIQAHLRAEIAQQVERSNVNEFESILDKFIRENPRITRAKAEFYNPVNMAKQSVEEDDELVTETLANVYYKQGNFKKAIRVYEKLCLIYPHKMSYFASLIQKIKTENKD